MAGGRESLGVPPALAFAHIRWGRSGCRFSGEHSLFRDLCVYFGSLKSWCGGMRLSGCFLSGASRSRVVPSAVNCNRSLGFGVGSAVPTLPLLVCLSFVPLGLMLRLSHGEL